MQGREGKGREGKVTLEGKGSSFQFPCTNHLTEQPHFTLIHDLNNTGRRFKTLKENEPRNYKMIDVITREERLLKFNRRVCVLYFSRGIGGAMN